MKMLNFDGWMAGLLSLTPVEIELIFEISHDFPDYEFRRRIWRDKTHYEAIRRPGARSKPHTVVTSSLAELRNTLQDA